MEIMKTKIFLFLAFLFLSCSITIGKETKIRNNSTDEGTFSVYAIPDLYNLTKKWTSEYERLNPLVKINVIQSENTDITGMLDSDGKIGFVSEEYCVSQSIQSNWKIVVGRDVIVPVMNASNPFLDEIYRKGISSRGLSRILENTENQYWGMILGSIKNSSIPCFISNDAAVKSEIANFAKIDPLKIDGITVISDQEMITAIQKDTYALGFCKLISIIDPNNQGFVENIRLVPIDKNENGKIDNIEGIYDNLQTFMRGVWIGKYPRALSGTIYSVSSEKPKNRIEVAFLKWVVTDGQQFLGSNGYNDLVYNERQTQLEKIGEPEIEVASTNTSLAILKMILLVLIAFGIISYVTNRVVWQTRNRKKKISTAISSVITSFDADSVIVPKGLYFDKTHTWAFMKKDGIVKIGIDDFIQHVTSSITRIEMKNAGEKIQKGDLLLTIIRNGKRLKFYSPVSGTIKSQNESLVTNSSLINSAPYSEGWAYMIEPSNWLREIQFLSMSEKYKTWLTDEFSRLKDFLIATLKINAPENVHVVFQDGGALQDNVLADLGPEVWEDFQTKFMDSVR